MNSKRLILAVVSLCMAAGVANATLTVKVDWADFLARHDLVWNRAPHAWYNGPFLGNGMLGSVFFQQDDQTLRINVGRSDAEDHQKAGHPFLRNARLPIGYFTLKTRGEITGFEGRLDLYNAEARAKIITEVGQIEIRALVHSDDMLIIYQLIPSGGESASHVVWHAQKAIAPARKLADETAARIGAENLNRFLTNWYSAPYEYNPNPEEFVSDGIRMCRQRLKAGGEIGTAWRMKDGLDGSKLLLVSIEHSYPEQNAVEKAADHLKAVGNFDDLIQRHRAWWHAYYPASFVSLDDTRLESYYWIQVYKFASGARKGRAFMDVMGPWFADSMWANAWFNLNTQLSYWFLPTANRMDVAESLFTKLDESLPTLVENMPPRFEGQCAGLYTIAPQTLRSPFPDHLQSLGDLTWLCHDYWLMLQRTMDADRIQNRFFPLLKKAVNTYLYVMEEGEDGKIHIPKSFSPEYPGGWGKDTTYNLSLFRWGCSTLVEICERYRIHDELLPRWKDVLVRLTDYPVNENGYMIAEGIPFEKSHRHYSHLLMVYPLCEVNVEQADAAGLIEQSVSHWINYPGNGNCGYSWSAASSMYALLQDGEKAAFYLDRFLRQSELYPENPSALHPTTMYTETRRFQPTTETPFSACDSLHRMLLQSWGGTIRIFPAVPDAWKHMTFHGLLAEGAFEVSAAREASRTRFVRIKSLAGEPCYIKTGMDGFLHVDGVSKKNVKRRADGTLELNLKKGEEAFIWSGSKRPAALIKPVVSIPGEANTFGLP